jgi:uncharacterized membrane protein
VTSHASTRFRRRGLAGFTAAAVLAALAVAASAPAAVGTSSAGSRHASDRTDGFVLDRGRVERIRLPGQKAPLGLPTLNGINNKGRIAGKAPYSAREGFYGFVLDRRRQLRRIEFPGALATYANKIDERGRIVGEANTTAPRVTYTPGTFAYLFERGRFERIAYPDAVSTRALGLNKRGQVVGEYLDQAGVIHGFRWKHGRFRTVDGPLGTGASISDINDRGDMVGAYGAEDGTIRGFVLRKGEYTTFAVPGFAATAPFDVNNRGQIAGTAISDPDLTEVHGFLLRRGADGPVKQIDVPGASSTAVTGLDDRGRLVGFYQNQAAAPTAPSSRAATMPQLDALLPALAEPR